MDPEGVLNLFDACWFNLEIFKKQSFSSNSAIDEAVPDQEVEENTTSGPKFSSLPSILLRSKSDQLSAITSFSSDTLSPNSVLLTPHLQTILSGKEAAVQEESRKPKRFGSMKGRLVKNRGVSKSLSDLEFEELKGFMDLGFVFSEEDKESSLVEIIPGLQRLGEEKDHRNHHQQEEEGSAVKESLVPRPYLSEAWEVLGRREKENPLMNWRVPALSDEMDMKDNHKEVALTDENTPVKPTKAIRHAALHHIGREKRGSREDSGFFFEVDFPDEVTGRVGDVGIAEKVDGNIVVAYDGVSGIGLLEGVRKRHQRERRS
ncbi:hypothetical protein RJ639_024683 [Escallonia herrerae]|uniref:Uncharacterized protein n=1 Tax=Escallonia herrerae TaxID=1293975 RepID=A0AA89AE75_9ASTE|nr:hypothetical protein RJ639_024683 [Escallonia herrerae]